jgi:hypothetical protein
MASRCLLGMAGAGLVLLVTSLSSAQCSKDTECKGERICEAGQCVAPSPSAPPAAVSAAPPAPAAPLRAAPLVHQAPKTQHHSQIMLVSGVVLVSLAPVGLFVATMTNLFYAECRNSSYALNPRCDTHTTITMGALVGGFACAVVGVPLIAIGGKREPVGAAPATATIAPWATPQAAGLGLRIDL